MKRCLLVLTFASACRSADAPSAGDRSALVATPKKGDVVVATVDGRPITAAEIALQARAAGTDPRTALSALVDAEVLAGEAAGRGLLDDPDVVDARTAAEARRLLATDFEMSTTPDRIPDAEYRRAYESHRASFDHPEGVELYHLVAVAKRPEATAALRQQARAQIAALLPKAAAATSDAAFAALANEHPAAGEVPVHVEHFTTPRTGMVEEPFAEAAFALTKPGQLSGIVESSYGFHLIRYVGRVPEKHVDLEAAKAEIRDPLFPAWRKRDLDRYLRELMGSYHVVTHPDRLATPEAK